MAANRWRFTADLKQPAPTVWTGGINRLLQCWESCRDRNAGGYGSGVVQQIAGWGHPRTVTSCSPFTATAIGMMFDPNGGTTKDVYEPLFDNGAQALPSAFYAMHNGFFLKMDKKIKDPKTGAEKEFSVDDTTKISIMHQIDWWKFRTVDESYGSAMFFNLGYLIDPKDMRRGDLLKIEWDNGNGHSTFCWDVHLDDGGVVDCFQFVSANSGPGVSVGCGAKDYLDFFEHDTAKKTWKKKFNLFEDKEDYVEVAHWMCRPKGRAIDVDKKTFKKKPKHVFDLSMSAACYGFVPKSVGVLRFWGVAPPERTQTDPQYQVAFELAKKLAVEKAPEPFAMGKAPAFVGSPLPPVKPTKVEGARIKQDPAAPAKVETKPVQQKKDSPTPHQNFVEDSLKELFRAKWIDHDPGDSNNVNDEKTRAAVKEFQQKYDCPPVDGIAGPITRRGLDDAVTRFRAGEPQPKAGEKAKPTKKHEVKHLYLTRNKMTPGGKNVIGVHGQNLDLVEITKVVLKDIETGAEEILNIAAATLKGLAGRPFDLPARFKAGAQVKVVVEGKTKDGAQVKHEAPVPVKVVEQVEGDRALIFTIDDKRAGRVDVWRTLDNKAFFYRSKLALDADGAPNAYHAAPDTVKGLDNLGNAGKPGNWWGIVTTNGKATGEPVIQTSGEFAGFYLSPTSLGDRTKAAGDPARYVDSTKVPYISIPGHLPNHPPRHPGRLGDFCAVYYRKTGKVAYAIFADVGPRTAIGEGSIQLGDDLGTFKPGRRRDARGNNGVDGPEVFFVIFPGSAKSPAWPVDVATIRAEGNRLFDEWGGLARLKRYYNDVNA